MKLLEAVIQARDDAFNEGPEGRRQMPRWLSASLIALILINIVSYIAVTWITVGHIDGQIALLHAANGTSAHLSNQMPKFIAEEQQPTTSDHLHNSDSISAKIKALETRRADLITGVIIEIVLDLVDLMDVFIGNFFIHVIYLVTKLFSLGLWSYSQLEQSNSAVWLLPLCICLLIILVHLRWFTALRKWVLALCIILGTAAWTTVLLIRCRQINSHISKLQSLNHHLKDEQEKERLQRAIDGELANRLHLSIGAFLMIIFGSMGLFAECCHAPIVAIVVGLLHTIGFVLWIVKITFFTVQEADVLFCVPLIYALLTIAIFIVFLFEIRNRLRKNGKKKVEKKKGRKKVKGVTKVWQHFTVGSPEENEKEEEEGEDEDEDSEQQAEADIKQIVKTTAKSHSEKTKATTKTKTKTNTRTAKNISRRQRIN